MAGGILCGSHREMVKIARSSFGLMRTQGALSLRDDHFIWEVFWRLREFGSEDTGYHRRVWEALLCISEALISMIPMESQAEWMRMADLRLFGDHLG